MHRTLVAIVAKSVIVAGRKKGLFMSTICKDESNSDKDKRLPSVLESYASVVGRRGLVDSGFGPALIRAAWLLRARQNAESPSTPTNGAMDAIAWLERCFQYVPDCSWRDDLRRFIDAQRHQ